MWTFFPLAGKKQKAKAFLDMLPARSVLEIKDRKVQMETTEGSA
jgi:hypothetical protein